MDTLKVITDARALITAGNSVKGSAFFTNIEASAAALYGVAGAVLALLDDFGIHVEASPGDLHKITNGWVILASLGYAVYRVATNTEAGLPPRNIPQS